MSTPDPDSPSRPPVDLPVDEEEISRFRAWLEEQGYTHSSTKLWASHVRNAAAHGISSPDDVDATFLAWSNSYRCGIRQALRFFDEFREGSI